MDLIMIYFEPQPDITTFELAAIFGHTGCGEGHCPAAGLAVPREYWDAMEPSHKRHFVTAVPSSVKI